MAGPFGPEKQISSVQGNSLFPERDEETGCTGGAITTSVSRVAWMNLPGLQMVSEGTSSLPTACALCSPGACPQLSPCLPSNSSAHSLLRREKGQRSWRGGKVTVGEKHMESKGHSVGEVIKSESGAQASETQAVILALLCRFETLSSETFSN